MALAGREVNHLAVQVGVEVKKCNAHNHDPHLFQGSLQRIFFQLKVYHQLCLALRDGEWKLVVKRVVDSCVIVVFSIFCHNAPCPNKNYRQKHVENLGKNESDSLANIVRTGAVLYVLVDAKCEKKSSKTDSQ